MRKGEVTREAIVREAAALFNVQGYGGGSMSQLMARTGLKKGGIYNHFSSKEEIVAEAFDYAMKVVNLALAEVMRRRATPKEKLLALFEYYREFPFNPPMVGGCPLLNAAVEAADTNPALKARVGAVFQEWQRVLARTIAKGVAQGEFKPGLDCESLAGFIIASIEGGILVTRGGGDPETMTAVAGHLKAYVENQLAH